MRFHLYELTVTRRRRALACEPPATWAFQNLTSPEDVGKLATMLFQSILGNELLREHMMVFQLDRRNRVIGYELVGVGTVSSVETSAADVFRSAILLGASSVIMAHNHPSGDCSPSKEDEWITKRMIDAGMTLGIALIDHVIVGAHHGYSFANKIEFPL